MQNSEHFYKNQSSADFIQVQDNIKGNNAMDKKGGNHG